jgi:short-subunit dehydrogenase
MHNQQPYALVTGASSGIGWHISEELAKKGYHIVAVSNQPERLNDLKQILENEYRINVITVNIDLAEYKSGQQVYDLCEKNNLNVEVLINNAGTLYFGEVIKMDGILMRSIMNLHMTTPAILCRLFGQKMIGQGKGFILNTSSISSVMPYPAISVYGPTKAFLRYFTRALRTEVKRYGIKVTCLIPGATATGLYDSGRFNTPVKRKLGIMKEPKLVAKAAVRALFRNRPECIPGFLNKLIVFLVPLIPHSIIGTIYKRTSFFDQSETT